MRERRIDRPRTKASPQEQWLGCLASPCPVVCTGATKQRRWCSAAHLVVVAWHEGTATKANLTQLPTAVQSQRQAAGGDWRGALPMLIGSRTLMFPKTWAWGAQNSRDIPLNLAHVLEPHDKGLRVLRLSNCQRTRPPHGCMSAAGMLALLNRSTRLQMLAPTPPSHTHTHTHTHTGNDHHDQASLPLSLSVSFSSLAPFGTARRGQKAHSCKQHTAAGSMGSDAAAEGPNGYGMR